MSTPSPLTRDGFIQAQDAIAQAAEEKAAQRQHAKKKLTARERLSLFFDDGVWHEVGQFIGGSVREGRIGSAVAAGYGRVQGRMVAADLRAGVILAVNHDGDSDSTGAIAGNLLGALYGVQAIPAEWLTPLELREVIDAVAHDLYATRDGDKNDARLRERYPVQA